MRYFSNYEADIVIREDDNGQRFVRGLDGIERGPAAKDDKEAWGIPNFSYENFLTPITKEEYEGFVIWWDWGPYGEAKRVFGRGHQEVK